MPARRPQKGPVTGPANGARAGRSPHYLRQWASRGAGRAAFLALGPSHWFDAHDLLSTSQTTLPNRVGSGEATLAGGAVALPGSGYVYLPGTANNNLSVTKGIWGGTLHVTATKTDDTAATYTTTADPVLIGNTLLTAGWYKRIDIRENDANGAIHTTINLQTDTLGQASFTCSTGQTVTVNRSTSGLTTAVVVSPSLMGDGSNNYVQFPSNATPVFTATTGGFTQILSFRRHQGTSAGFTRLYSSESATSRGCMILLWNSSPYVRGYVGGVSSQTATGVQPPATYVASALEVVALVVNAGSASFYRYGSGLGTAVNITSYGTITHGIPRLLSQANTVASTCNAEVPAAATFSRALSLTELNTAAAFLSGSYA